MKNFYLIAIFIACLFSSTGKSQNLNWTQPAATGTGNSSVAVLANAVLLNNNPITTAGALIGAFYLDNSGNLICGGYAELTQNFIDGNATNIAVWGSDAGEDNGFETNEIMNLYLNLDGVDYPADENTVWALGGEVWEPNGLYAISSINFTPETTSNLDPCTCADGSEGTYFEAQGFCVLQTDYCSDSSANNYCNIEGLIMLGNGSENCDFGGETINGCTCPIAVNYNPDANNDDGSCIAETGCSDSLADNYSTSGCDDITITNPNCEYSGCTCPVALGYNPDATNDDGSCFTFTGICTDPTASNFTEGCDVSLQFGDGDVCEYEGCEASNLEWDFTITDGNMTVQVGADVVTINGATPPTGSLLGAFYINDNGEYACAGYQPWTGDQLAIAVWKSESGLDNGFAAGEEFNWFLSIGEQTFTPENTTMNSGGLFSETFVSQGFGQVLSLSYECEITGVFGCNDEAATNYDEAATINDGSCIYAGCTNEEACNYDASAGVDNGSCVYEQTFYADQDGDGLGDPNINISITSCENPGAGYVTNNNDPCPNNLNNLGNIVMWYLDEDGDGNGSDIYIWGDDSFEDGCTPPGSNFSDNNNDPCPYDPNDTDIDEDGICDDEDDCVGTLDALNICNGDCAADDDGDGICDDVDDCIGSLDACGICNGPGEIYECGCADIPEGDCDCNGNTLDALNVCGGSCQADTDEDGICDDEDDCIGALDDCGICNGPGEIYECGCADIPEGDCDCNGNTLDALNVCGGSCEADDDGDGICNTDEIVGCQDETACNYNPNATESCGGNEDPMEIEGFSFAISLYGSDYYLSTSPANWLDAYNTCLEKGGNLLVFDSQQEYEAWSGLSVYDPTSNDLLSVWIGLSDAQEEGVWSWVNGSDFQTNYWIENAPNGADLENYAILEYGGTLEDEPANNSYYYVLEMEGACCTYVAPNETCGGCTDENACNYEPLAVDDDGSCILPISCYLDEDGDGLGYDPDGLGLFTVSSCSGCNEGYADNSNDQSEGDFDNDGVFGTPFSGNDCDDTDPNVGAPETGYNCQGECINDSDNDTICDEFEIQGCTDSTACNYNEEATDDDNSCDYPAEYYDCNSICLNDADGDTVCDELEINGCADSTACNYNELATDDDNSCLYETLCEICVNGNIVDNDADNDGVCDDDEILGCDDNNACNFDANATENDNSCIYTDGICQTCVNGDIIDNDVDNDGICDDDEIPGCTDPNACNFDPELGCTDDDGSCFYSNIVLEYATSNVSCVTACDGEIQLEILNGQPPYIVQYTPLNDIENVTTNGGDLNAACFGTYNVLVSDSYNCEAEITISVETDYPDSDGDGVCDNNEIFGCDDSNACNYDANVTENDGSCEYCFENNCAFYPPTFYDCNGECYIDNDFDGVCDELEITGCTDDEACNFSINYSDTCDDNNSDGIPDCCTYPEEYYLECNGTCTNDSDNDGVCDEIEILGCQENEACNFNPQATDEGTCIYPEDYYNCEGCIVDTDGDGVCDELEIVGCQDGLACNFDPEATEEGACYYLDLSTFVDGVVNVTCSGSSNGAFSLYASGGNGPYILSIPEIQINLSSNDGIFIANNLPGGSYDVFINDVNGCETLETVDIEEPSLIDITIEYLNYVSCEGDGDGSLTTSIQGGIPPYYFQWLDAQGNVISQEQDILNLSAGAYAVEVTDDSGCSNQESFIVGNPNPLTIDVLNINDVSCYGGNDGSVEIFISGGASPFTYFYTDNNGDYANPNLLIEGNYTVTITDDNGCILTADFDIEQPNSQIEVSITASDNEVCEDEMVTITATPGYATYIWSEIINGEIFDDNDNTLEIINESGSYMVTALNDQGCEAMSEYIDITVYENPVTSINGEAEGFTGNTYNYYVTNTNDIYEWYLIDNAMGTINGANDENSVEITWELEGTATLALTQTNENGCSTTELIDVIISWPTLIEEISQSINFTVYPNPFKDYTTIEISNPNNVEYHLYLYDLKGTLVKSFSGQNESKIQLDDKISKGIYHLQLVSPQGNFRKIIVSE